MARLVVILFSLLALASPARGAPVDAGNALVDLIAEREAVAPGDRFYAALSLDMDEGWHVYWRNPGDAGLPPVIAWTETSGVDIADFVWPAPHELPVVEGEIMDYGYDDQLILPFEIAIPEDAADRITLTGLADYLICKDICIPESAEIRLDLAVLDAGYDNPASGAQISGALAEAPSAFRGDAAISRDGEAWTLSLKSMEFGGGAAYLRFFPFDHDIVHAAPQPASFGPEGATLTLTGAEEADGPLNGVVVLEGAGGARAAWEISAQPGAPFAGAAGAPINAAGAIDAAAASSDTPLTLSNILFVVGLALLGGLILNLMPCVLPVLSIKAMGLVHAGSHGDAGHVRMHGLLYTAGVLMSFAAIAAAFIALRGAGEFVTIGFLLQYPAIVAGLALLAFLVALWMLGMFELGTSLQNVGAGAAARQGGAGAFFTGLLAAAAGAPCVAPFMGVALGAVITQPAPVVLGVYLALGLGLAAPFLILSFAPGLHRFMPKPGPWMDRLKQFFAFPLFLTAAVLLFVLGAQAGAGAVAWTVVGASLIAFGVWALKISDGRLRPVGYLAGAAGLAGGAVLSLQAAANGSPSSAAIAYAAEYQTQPWSPETVDGLLADGKGVFVDFTATWCATCQVNKATTLKRDAVLEAFRDNNVAFLVADFTNRDPMIADELRKRSRPGVPMYLFYAPGASEPQILPEVLTPGLVIDVVKSATS